MKTLVDQDAVDATRQAAGVMGFVCLATLLVFQIFGRGHRNQLVMFAEYILAPAMLGSLLSIYSSRIAAAVLVAFCLYIDGVLILAFALHGFKVSAVGITLFIGWLVATAFMVRGFMAAWKIQRDK